MKLNSNLKNVLLVIFATLVLSACSTAKKSGDIDGDVYYPEINLEGWKETSSVKYEKDSENEYDFNVIVFEKN